MYDPDNLRNLFAEFMAATKQASESQWTVNFYQANVPKLLWWCENIADPPVTRYAELTNIHLRGFLTYLKETKQGRFGSKHPRSQQPLSAAGQHAIARGCRAFVMWVVRERNLPPGTSPWYNIKMPKTDRHWRPTTLSDDQVNTVLAAVDTVCESELVKRRTRAIFQLALETGMRISEILSLQGKQIAKQDRIIRVRGKGKRVRVVPVSDIGWAELVRWLQIRADMPNATHDYVFVTDDGRPAQYSTIRQVVRRIQESTEIRVHMHLYRSSAATRFRRAGMDLMVLQEVMGHSSINITKQYYSSITDDDIREATQYSPLRAMAAEHNLYMPARTQPPPSQQATETRKSRVELPHVQELYAEVQQHGLRVTARKYGVDHKSISKRLKKAGM